MAIGSMHVYRGDAAALWGAPIQLRRVLAATKRSATPLAMPAYSIQAGIAFPSVIEAFTSPISNVCLLDW